MSKTKRAPFPTYRKAIPHEDVLVAAILMGLPVAPHSNAETLATARERAITLANLPRVHPLPMPLAVVARLLAVNEERLRKALGIQASGEVVDYPHAYTPRLRR